MNYSFICRPSKCDRNGFAPIECSIVLQGKQKVFTLERREKPSVFKKLTSQKANNDLKIYLDLMRNKLNKGINEMMLSGMDVSLQSLRDYVKNDGIRQYTLGELVDAFLKQQRNKVIAGECTEGVYNKYVIIINHFIKHITRYVELNAITPAQIDAFYIKMRAIYKDSTLSGQMFRLKSVFNYALVNNMMKTNPFKVDIQRAAPKIEYLEDDELELLRNTNIPNESLSRIRDLALFQAASGLSYADMASLSSDDVKTSDNGVKFIQKERCKTGIEYTAVLLPDAIRIWDKYSGILPTISNQKYNMYLKLLADICGIKKNLHTHIFRKTYATTLLNSGVRALTVSKAVGHTSTKQTLATYAFLKKTTILDEITASVSSGVRTQFHN